MVKRKNFGEKDQKKAINQKKDAFYLKKSVKIMCFSIFCLSL